MRQANLLFSQFDWFTVQEHQKRELRAEVVGYDGNRLLNTSVEDMCAYLVEKYSIHVPTLLEDEILVDQREAQINVAGRIEYMTRGPGPHYVPGTTIEVSIPFEGEAHAFHIRPSTYSLNPPRGVLRDDLLLIEVTGTNMEVEEVRSEIESRISAINENLTNLRKNAQALSLELPAIARQEVNTRRDKLLANQNLVSNLGFKLKENPKSPRTYTAPEVRRKIRPEPPRASGDPYRPEPTLSETDYDHILGVIQNMAEVMERTPAAFSKMDEEALRTHFLVQLNGHYEGQATGETFNFEGKTDILIRVDGKNIFVAECKFWRGPKNLADTIDQLLGYSSWRDTKVALLLFNRNKNLSKVLESIGKTVTEHPRCKRKINRPSETEFRYLFSHRDDPNRELTMTVVVFEVPN